MITIEQKENLIKWVKALRSNKYKQCAFRLVNKSQKGISYCCLGVAGRVIGLSIEYLDNISGDFLSLEQERKFGLTLEQQKELAKMNDKGSSFLEIADRIVEMFGLQKDVQ